MHFYSLTLILSHIHINFTYISNLLLILCHTHTPKGNVPGKEHSSYDVLTPQTCEYDYVDPQGNMVALVDDYSQIGDDYDQVDDAKDQEEDGSIHQSKLAGENWSPTPNEQTGTNCYQGTAQPEQDLTSCHLQNSVGNVYS